ncbi:hypothetical protein B0A48_02904 [Cryoendolithus antarcticus]|uniref:DUF6594 domain-containing protein n=1 Tax=Cryoendolithus antarcticus TaxID=1507870 RepID=A0A1V8TLJ8_9PEZI|nr:hypothetical protein B0A48_02904 [Cryoendolithus antarcticus]
MAAPQGQGANGYRPGYPQLATFMSQNPETAIVRKFSTLAMLNVLRLQAELQDMEAEFHEIVEEDSQSGNPTRQKYSRDFSLMRNYAETVNAEERSLQLWQITNIGNKLHEYKVAIDDAAALNSLHTPSSREVDALINLTDPKSMKAGWLNRPDGGRSFLCDREKDIWTAENMEDLISLAPPRAQQDVFTSFLDGALTDIYHRIWGKRKETQPGFRDYSQKQTSRASTVIVTVLSSALPTITVLVLFFIHSLLIRIGLVIVFTALFSLALAVFSSADKATIFTATAT